LFNAFFGGNSPFGASSGPALGGDIAAAVEMTLLEASVGAKVEVSFEAIDRCEHCHGNGAEPGTPIERCSRCRGAGQVQSVVRTPFGQMMRTSLCDACHGDGRLPTNPCGECRGRGQKAVKRGEQVSVPAGIADGQRIRVSGRGHAGERGAPAGDLYVLVRVRPDERFVREGDDLITALDVSAPLASLGVTLEVSTLDGPVPIEVPAGTQPGEVLTVRGQGMPSLRGGRRGELRVVINIVIPRRLSDAQRELLGQLSNTLTDDNLCSDESVFAKLRRVLRHQAA
jgi:molecular chaperone DnaJ